MAHMGARVLSGKLEGKRALGRLRCRKEDNMKTYLSSTGMGKAWTGLICLRIGAGDGSM